MTHSTQNCKEINDHLTSVSFYTSSLEQEPFTDDQKIEMLRQEHVNQIEAYEEADFISNYYS
jgi:hypothetical protein